MSNEPASHGQASQGPVTQEPKFQCPACRASQPLQDTCRRCGADLRLLAKAKRHVAALIKRRESAIRIGDEATAKQIASELKLLQPR